MIWWSSVIPKKLKEMKKKRLVENSENSCSWRWKSDTVSVLRSFDYWKIKTLTVIPFPSGVFVMSCCPFVVFWRWTLIFCWCLEWKTRLPAGLPVLPFLFHFHGGFRSAQCWKSKSIYPCNKSDCLCLLFQVEGRDVTELRTVSYGKCLVTSATHHPSLPLCSLKCLFWFLDWGTVFLCQIGRSI